MVLGSSTIHLTLVNLGREGSDSGCSDGRRPVRRGGNRLFREPDSRSDCHRDIRHHHRAGIGGATLHCNRIRCLVCREHRKRYHCRRDFDAGLSGDFVCHYGLPELHDRNVPWNNYGGTGLLEQHLLLSDSIGEWAKSNPPPERQRPGPGKTAGAFARVVPYTLRGGVNREGDNPPRRGGEHNGHRCCRHIRSSGDRMGGSGNTRSAVELKGSRILGYCLAAWNA